MRSIRKVATAVFLLLAQMTIAAGTWAQAAASSGDAPIRIGVSLGLSGHYSTLGRMHQMSYQLYESQVNKRGGILGRPVKIIVHDDKSDPKVAEEIYRQFIEEEKVDFVFTPYSSLITSAVIPLTEKHGYPMLAPGAASDALWTKGYQNLFGMFPPANRFVIGFYSLLSEANIKRVAIVSGDDTFSMSAAEGAKRWAGDYGLTVVDYRIVPIKNPDFETAAKSAREAGAEALVMAGDYAESVKMRRALKTIGWTPKGYYTSTGANVQKFYEELGKDAQGTFSTTVWEPRDDLRMVGSTEFLKAFSARYQEAPAFQAAMAYAACQVLEQAIVKARSTNRAAVRAAIASLDVYTIIGRYSVDAAGVPSKSIPLITQWQGSKREIIWPEELSTAKPIFSK